jgi:hypothetical protein
MEKFNTFQDFKYYVGNRNKVRINCCGLTNTRITRIRLKQLKGFVKQINNGNITSELSDQLSILEKEIEFRQLCLEIKSVFSIDIK